MVPGVTTATDHGHYQALNSHHNHHRNCNINNKSPYRIQRHRKHLRQLTRLTQLCRRLEAYRRRVTHHHIIMTSNAGNTTTTAITTTAGTPIEAKVCKISVNNSVINNYNTSNSSNNRELKSQLKCFWPKCEFKTRARDSLKLHYSVHYKCKQFCCTVKGCDKVFKYKTNLVKHRASHRSPAAKPLGKARANTTNARNVMSGIDGIANRDVADGPESSNDSNVFNNNNSNSNTNSNNECHKHHIPSSLALHALHSADSRSNSSDSVFAVKSDSGGPTGGGGGGVTAHKSPAVNRWAAAGIGTAVGANRTTTTTATPTTGITNTTNAVTLRANGQSVVTTSSRTRGDGKFRCEYTGCGKLFGLKTQLIQHKSVVHLNQTLYSCDYPACDQMFNKKVNLKRHKNTVHLGLKPFSCDYQNCGKKFTQKTHLLQHRRRQHLDFGPSQPPKRFKCYYHMCNKSYDSIYDLKTHVVAAHIASSAGAAAPVMASGGEGVAAPVVDDKALTTCSEQNCNKSFKTFFNLYFHRKTEHQFIG